MSFLLDSDIFNHFIEIIQQYFMTFSNNFLNSCRKMLKSTAGGGDLNAVPLAARKCPWFLCDFNFFVKERI